MKETRLLSKEKIMATERNILGMMEGDWEMLNNPTEWPQLT